MIYIIELGLKKTYINNNMVCIDPILTKPVGDNHKNQLISEILNQHPELTVNQVEEEYKKIISKIHFQIHSMGYSADSTGINNLEIRIMDFDSKNDRFLNNISNSCSALILHKLNEWRTSKEIVKYDNISNGSTSIKAYPDSKMDNEIYIKRSIEIINNIFHVNFNINYNNFQNGIVYFETIHNMSKKMAREKLTNILKKISNIEYVNTIKWNADFTNLLCTFSNMENIDKFSKNLIENYVQLSKSIYLKQSIQEWFNSKFNLKIDGKQIPFKLSIEKDTLDRQFLYLQNPRLKNESTKMFLNKLFSNLKDCEIQEISNKYFNCNFPIYLGNDYCDDENYLSIFITLRNNIISMLEEMLEKNMKNSKK